MASSLLSLALNHPLDPTIAMTGELTVTGKVLRIGGLREKTVAARRAGATKVIFPADNTSDWLELPEVCCFPTLSTIILFCRELALTLLNRTSRRASRATQSAGTLRSSTFSSLTSTTTPPAPSGRRHLPSLPTRRPSGTARMTSSCDSN